ncbi:hepatic sodium/bile acid cotransporter-like [Betta splendens]|uniref:Hepatic sodium/bile acid cotransporter-like n=1 Tax=Betta splendens TaxID=158456 RepID=A0A6P7LL72_BETSP|nr:hepatic sodium/bile acid cotransporter-like [Betta splendens]
MTTMMSQVHQNMTGFYTEGNVSSNGTILMFENSTLNKVLNVLTICMLLLTMISIGLSVEILKMKAYFLKPKEAAMAMLAQFGIMPLASFCISKGLHLERIKALALIIYGCCPGGTFSNLFSLAIKGDINLSIVMTTCSNIAALGMMPLLLYIYCQNYRGLEKLVPYLNIIIALALTMVPCAFGIAIKHYKPQHVLTMRRVSFSLLGIISTTVLVLTVYSIKDQMLLVLSADILTAAVLLPLTGYMLGYAMSRICKLDSKCSRTISMETGCQNTNLCLTILKIVFPPQLIGPNLVFPFVFLLMQVFEALLLILVYRCYKKTQTRSAKIHRDADVQPEAVQLQQHHEEAGTEEEDKEKLNFAH